MSNDSFTEVTHTGWLSRLGKSITGVLLGFALVVGSFVLLWWNEGRSVTTYQGLKEGEKIAMTIAADVIDASHEGKLVHLVGHARAKDEVTDPVFGPKLPGAVKLRRKVEMFQWVETKKTTTKTKLGGGEETVTEYQYQQEWSEKFHPSSEFRHPQGHANVSPAHESKTFFSHDATIGVFALPAFLIEQWKDLRPLPVAIDQLKPEHREKAQAQGDWVYLLGRADRPANGDLRIKFDAIPEGDASVLVRQVRDTFEPYLTQVGTKIARINAGVHSKDSMFAAAQAENTLQTWLLRGLGALLMFIGIVLVFQPFKVLADVLPLAGRIVGAGTGMIAMLLAGMGSTITISLAWLWYRPFLGAAVLVGTVALFVLLIRRFRTQSA
ncbi:MAG: hypothetical protein RI957_791 [Verrucomicrobiota bacterium]|jgi:hypothetical protein